MSSKTIYDKHGNRIGEDVFSTDRDGRVQIRHYDSRNNLVGRSYETTDYKGDVYMIHEDASGNILSRSTMEKDWWGEYYIKTEPDKRYSRNNSEKKYSEELSLGTMHLNHPHLSRPHFIRFHSQDQRLPPLSGIPEIVYSNSLIS